jgi:hypothetical protein
VTLVWRMNSVHVGNGPSDGLRDPRDPVNTRVWIIRFHLLDQAQQLLDARYAENIGFSDYRYSFYSTCQQFKLTLCA